MTAMIPVNLVERSLRAFEQHVSSPIHIKQAAKFLRYWFERKSKASFDIISAIQQHRLHNAVNYMYHRSPAYRQIFICRGLGPSDILTVYDLQLLPFTTSQDIRDWQNYLCIQAEALRAVFTTAGTTGEPKRFYYSQRDLETLSNLEAVFLRLLVPERLVVLVALPMIHGLWIGSAKARRIIERAGGLPIIVGTDNPKETLKWMQRFSPNLVISSPSYFTALTREAGQIGYQLRLEAVVLGGETLTDNHKALFSKHWDAQVYNVYGSTEIGGGKTIALPECNAFHLDDLQLVTEIIDPDTGVTANEGELVFTTLSREAMPLLRYRSGDRGRWTKCACERPLRAIQFLGRIDDLIVAGDMNLYGNVLANAIAQIPRASGRVAILLDKLGLTDRLLVRVEGEGVSEEKVRQVLFRTYPELPTNIANGNLVLVIDVGVRLGKQIKALKIEDARFDTRKI